VQLKLAQSPPPEHFSPAMVVPTHWPSVQLKLAQSPPPEHPSPAAVAPTHLPFVQLKLKHDPPDVHELPGNVVPDSSQVPLRLLQLELAQSSSAAQAPPAGVVPAASQRPFVQLELSQSPPPEHGMPGWVACAEVGADVGLIVAKQLVALCKSVTKPSRHKHSYLVSLLPSLKQ
jgi:hypothetical protein